MATIPFPLTAEDQEELRSQFFEMVRQLYEDRIGGLLLGDVFKDDGDYLTLRLASLGGLEKSLGELQIKLKSDGGLNTASTGALVKCKPFGGLDTDSSGLYVKSSWTKGYREGLNVTIKDASTLYVSGGAIDITGANYTLESQIEVSLGTVSANTLYYVYVTAPATDVALGVGQFSVSATAPTFSDSLGAEYMTGDATKRLLAKYYQAGLTLGPFYPAANGDDVQWNYALFYSGGYPNFALGYDRGGRPGQAYVRFPSVNINQGDTVSSAVLTFTAAAGTAGTNCKLKIQGNDIDTSVAPTNQTEGAALALTTAEVESTQDEWMQDTAYNLPDIATIIQEIIDRPGWSAGNAIGIVISENSGDNSPKYARCFDDGVAARYPKLAIVLSATSAVSKVIDNRRIDVGMDSDNVLNDEEILVYDTTIGGFKGVEKSTDGTLADNSDNAIPTEKAVKTYADTMVTKALFDANTIIAADTDDTPAAVTVAEQRLVGRITGGNIAALTSTQVRTMLDLYTDDDVSFAELDITGASRLGSLRVGDATNNTFICAGGIQKFSGTAQGALNLRPNLDYLNIEKQSVPTDVTRGSNRGFSMPIYNSDNEELFFKMRIPKRWNGTSDPQFGIMVSTSGAEDIGDKFKFQLSISTTLCGGTHIIPDTTSDYTTEQTIIAGGTAAYTAYCIWFTMDAGAAANAILTGSMLSGRVRRIAASANEVANEIIIWDWAVEWLTDKIYGPYKVESNVS